MGTDRAAIHISDTLAGQFAGTHKLYGLAITRAFCDNASVRRAAKAGGRASRIGGRKRVQRQSRTVRGRRSAYICWVHIIVYTAEPADAGPPAI